VSPFAWLCATFVALVAAGVPVAFAIAIASFVGYALIPDPFGSLSPYGLITDMTGGMKQISLIYIPFFILAGKAMGQGGVARRLIDLSRAFVGGVRGGTSYVSVLASMFFGAISGSGVADVASIGSVMIPEMRKEGYDAPFATAVTISAGTLGLVIPPSNIMVLYVVIAAGTLIPAGAYQGVGLDIRTMFLAGFLPGIVTGLALMAVCGILSHLRGYPKGRWLGPREVVRSFIGALFPMFIVAVILGGILFGIVTADESAALAVVLAVIAGVVVYREVPARQVLAMLRDSAVTCGVVFFLIAASNAMKFVFIHEGIDRAMQDLCLQFIGNRFAFLLVVNILLLVCGCFLDMTPAVLIFTPLLLPIAVGYGVHPIHFGIILTLNLCIGLCTPPVGNCLFVGCSVSKVPLTQMIRPLLPFYAAMFAALLVVTYAEAIPMWLPAQWLRWFPPLVGAGP
jgi:tripartite ATP-independent transporter DctM subunit